MLYVIVLTIILIQKYQVIYDNILPEFNKNNYRKLIHPTYPKDGVAWDWENKDNRIKFLEAIKRQCAVEYLSLRKY